MRLTNIKVRELYLLCFGRDPIIFDVDQQGIHMNKAGCKSRPSLEIEGCLAVALKENHAATRTRVSLMTHVCSDETNACRAGGLPIEVMFKGKSKAVIKGLEMPSGVHMSISPPTNG